MSTDHHPQTSVPLKIRIVNVHVLEWNCLEPGEDLLDILRPHHVDELREVRREEDDFEGVLAHVQTHSVHMVVLSEQVGMHIVHLLHARLQNEGEQFNIGFHTLSEIGHLILNHVMRYALRVQRVLLITLTSHFHNHHVNRHHVARAHQMERRHGGPRRALLWVGEERVRVLFLAEIVAQQHVGRLRRTVALGDQRNGNGYGCGRHGDVIADAGAGAFEASWQVVVLDGDEDDRTEGNERLEQFVVHALRLDEERVGAAEARHGRVHHHQLAVGAVAQREQFAALA